MWSLRRIVLLPAAFTSARAAGAIAPRHVGESASVNDLASEGSTATGVVRGPNGQALAGATVAVVAPEEDFGSVRCLTRTNEQGRFTCRSQMLDGHLGVSAVHPSGSGTATLPFPRSDDVQLSISTPEGSLSGDVRDRSGRAISNAMLRISRPKRLAFDDVYATTTDEHGTFRMLLPNGTYVVRAELGDRTARATLVHVEREASIHLVLSPPAAPNARAAAAEWARRTRATMATTEPTAIDDDLAALDGSFRGARVVGLGESTHGSRETFQLEHRLVRWLVERRGFATVALEANRSDVKAADDYVQLRTNDELAALRSLGFWKWRTEEVLGVLRWLRAHNATRPATERVRLSGIDVQSTSALELQRLEPPHDFAQRERAMADNVLADMRSPGGSNVVIWAHAGHVARGSFDGVTSMGELIARAVGGAYRPVLLSFRSGRFRAIDAADAQAGGTEISSFALPEAPPDTLESLVSAGADRPVVLDLRSNSDPEVAGWLESRVPTRWCGAVFVNERATAVLLEPRHAFDAVVVAPRSTPAISVGSSD